MTAIFDNLGKQVFTPGLIKALDDIDKELKKKETNSII